MRTLQLTFIALLTACDPAAVRQERPAAAPGKLEEQRSDVSGDRKGLAACLHSCDDGASSPTDRATCRLNCETAFKVTPTAAVDDGFTRATRCLQACRRADGRASGDANTCREACRTAAGAPVGAPLEQLEQCVGSCTADTALSDTDRATCDLTCTQEARRTAGVKN